VQLARQVLALGLDGAEEAPGELPQPLLHALQRLQHRDALGDVAAHALDLR
jgi:hypothetical protein